MSGSQRKLTLRARAARQAQTRQRIVAATVELHQQLGPLATSVSAIAERAGVERLTVYRHFPDQAALLEACTHQFFVEHPPPDLRRWAAIGDPVTRLRRALPELYAFWERTEPMLSSVLADYQHDPARAGGGAVAFMARAQDTLVAGWRLRGSPRTRLRASVGHAVHFYTWRSLVHEQGLSNRTAAALMTRFVLSSVEDVGPG